MISPNQKSERYIYLEVNNLCGFAMSKFIPTGRFKWIDPKHFEIDIAVIVRQVVF